MDEASRSRAAALKAAAKQEHQRRQLEDVVFKDMFAAFKAHDVTYELMDAEPARSRVYDTLQQKYLLDGALIDGLAAFEEGTWTRATAPGILADLLGRVTSTSATAFVVWEAEYPPLRVDLRGLPQVLAEVLNQAGIMDVYLMAEGGDWLLQLSRHGRYAFGMSPA